MTSRDQARLTLAAIEALRRQLTAADAGWAEIDKVAGILSARRDEAREVEAWLGRTKAAAEDATSRLDELQKTCAKEEARITARVDGLKSELLELEKTVAEKQAELNSVTAGMAALHRRLGAA